MSTQRDALPAPAQPLGIPGPFRAMRRWFRRLRTTVGRHISVRWKLTLWYGAMCALILALGGWGMATALDYKLNSDLNNSLISTATKMSRTLSRPLPAEPGRVADTVEGCNSVDEQVREYCAGVQTQLNANAALVSAPGQFEEVFLDIGAGPFVVTPGAGARPATGVIVPDLALLMMEASSHPVLHDYPGRGIRLYALRLSPPSQLRDKLSGVLVVVQAEGTYLQVERSFAVIIASSTLFGLIAATAAGWWIARAALRPINRFSRTVKAIGESKDLSRRLDHIGPPDEVGRLAETFDGMMDRLEKVFETQRRFIADASHELRTPLTAIRGNADLMRIAPPEERDICLTSIRQESERMSRLVTDLLLLAEADVASQPVVKRPVDLEEIVLDAYRSAQVVAGDRVNVSIERLEPVTVDADADRIKQLILNLADNAVKFTPPGGAVILSAFRDGDHAVIEVADSGIGIPLEDQAHIFDRFYRVEASRTRRGSGLGLSIVSWIVSAHGGTISVRSAPDKGSTFTVRLPGVVTE